MPLPEPANDPNTSAALGTGNAPATPPAPVPPVEPVVPPVVPTPEPTPQVPEPATPPVPEPTLTPEPTPVPTPEPATPPVPENTDNTFFADAKTVIERAGLDYQDIASKLDVNKGEVTQEVKDLLYSKLPASEANLLIRGYNTELTKVQDTQRKEADKVYETVGGKEEWEKIAAWTKTPEAGLSTEAAKEYNTMLKQGGVQAELAAKALKEAYVASPGFKQAANEPNLMGGGATPTPATGIEPISRAVYVEEKKKARNANDAVAVKALEDRASHTMDNVPDLWRGTLISG